MSTTARTRLFYTVQDVAPMFAASPKTIYSWIAAGKIPACRDPGGGVKFERGRIDHMVELMKKDLLGTK